MEITTDKKNLLNLVKDARKGNVVLPQFQRNFVWSRDDITDLLVSILKDYFIGSFLLLRTDVDNSPFAARPIQGVNIGMTELRHDWMVLDGQQRLTSLHYVFAAPDIPLRGTKYPYRFFLDLNKVVSGDIDEAITSQRTDMCNEELGREAQFKTLVVPFTELEHWNDWLNAYEQWLVEIDKELYFNEYFKLQKPRWNQVINNNLGQFQVPIIEIPKVQSNDPDRISEVCAIFEKMNSTGVRLSVYDLLTARLYKDDLDLHLLWRNSIEQYPLLREFSGGEPDVYGVFTLRTIALLRDIEVKSKTLINLNPQDFENDWRAATEYIEKALQRITSTNEDGFGAFDPKWAPYSTMVSTLAALLRYVDIHKMGHRAYKYIRKWYWGSVFLERYAGAVESTLYRDYRDLVAVFNDEQYTPDVFGEVDNRILTGDSFSLLGVTRVNSIYRGVMNLVAIHGAKDFQAVDSIEFHALDDHHIFPRAYLNKLKDEEGKCRYNPDEINTVVNRTLISGSTNRRISRNKPSNYLKKFVPEERKAVLMNSHFIDKDALAAMEVDDYEVFLLNREKLLLDEIRRQLQI